MKKILLFAFLLNAVCFANAQKLKNTEVPAVVKNAFEKKYPAIAATWEREKNNYEVNFKYNGSTMSAIIDPTGMIIETEKDIPVTALPANISDYIKQNYKGKTIKEAAEITKADGTINYEAEVNGKDLIFDANGKIIK